ncbi:NAD(P)H-dependent glycerol-3-phosphate dehydrogenase [Sheuella amnicola]|nr:NAD(P)H-dependent glycerol-3-phosphate dehydrogenase [Sheuella amnicola]
MQLKPDPVSPTTLQMRHVAVLGAGAWGNALAIAASANSSTMMWARNAGLIGEIQSTGLNARYLPGIKLPESLVCTSEFEHAINHATTGPCPGLLILGVPLAGLRQICLEISKSLKQSGRKIAGIIWTCKGLDAESGQLPSEIARQALSELPEIAIGVLSGPSFALEVAQNLPVALTIASTDAALREACIQTFHGGTIRVYASSDVIGVEIGGALKNIIAIACGISDGLGLGTNARAALITRGLAEIRRFGEALGAQASTFFGLTGLGDLVLTATGDLSRNRQVGLAIGKGQSLDEVLAQGLTAEGARCAKAVLIRANQLGVDLPITRAVCDVLYHHVTPRLAVSQLLARDATSE